MQRSDGSIYVYNDGARYPVNVASLGDEDIDPIPLATPVDRVDQLFTPSPPVSLPVASSTAARPQPGTLLYQADWSAGLGGWPQLPEWQATGGLLASHGGKDGSLIVAPYQAPTLDYAVEAEIQVVKLTVQPL